jgi:hypothetical protein
MQLMFVCVNDGSVWKSSSPRSVPDMHGQMSGMLQQRRSSPFVAALSTRNGHGIAKQIDSHFAASMHDLDTTYELH